MTADVKADRRQPRVFAMAPSALGALVAAFGYGAAIEPSLLPRTMLSMVLVGTIGAVVGYAVGAVVAAFLPMFGASSSTTLNRVGWLVAAAAWGLAIALTPRACQWQTEQQALLGLPQTTTSWPIVALASVVLLVVMVVIGRLIRGLGRAVARGIEWFRVPHAVSLAIGFVIATLAVAAFIGVAYEHIKNGYAVTNDSAAGQTQPTSPLRSGSPNSLSQWDKLGREGRFFVSTGPTPAQITSVTGKPAIEPIRAYVGLDEAYTAEERAALAVRELERTGAFDRGTLVVAVVTGTGWVDPDAANSIDVVNNGDVATVAVQYSYLPSWISFIVDKAAAVDTGKAEVNAIIEAWKKRPPDKRHHLILFGESLGSFGSQGAFASTVQPVDVVRDFEGVVWSGPPAESQLWSRWQVERTAGPAWQPTIDNGHVARVGVNDTQFAPDQSGWDQRRIAFAAHPNDPIVYWSGAIALHRPDWLNDPRGPGVDPHMTWWPLISFWQCGIDLMSAGNVPPGIGHNYTAELPTMFVGVQQPAGWTPEMTIKLKALLDVLRPASAD